MTLAISRQTTVPDSGIVCVIAAPFDVLYAAPFHPPRRYGVVLALKGEADLAISVVKNSVAQIAAFLFPALVLVSLLSIALLSNLMAILLQALCARAGAVPTVTEAVAFDWLGRAEGDAFKAISKMVR